jgi:hypothetical protein
VSSDLTRGQYWHDQLWSFIHSIEAVAGVHRAPLSRELWAQLQEALGPGYTASQVEHVFRSADSDLAAQLAAALPPDGVRWIHQTLARDRPVVVDPTAILEDIHQHAPFTRHLLTHLLTWYGDFTTVSRSAIVKPPLIELLEPLFPPAEAPRLAREFQQAVIQFVRRHTPRLQEETKRQWSPTKAPKNDQFTPDYLKRFQTELGHGLLELAVTHIADSPRLNSLLKTTVLGQRRPTAVHPDLPPLLSGLLEEKAPSCGAAVVDLLQNQDPRWMGRFQRQVVKNLYQEITKQIPTILADTTDKALSLSSTMELSQQQLQSVLDLALKHSKDYRTGPPAASKP